MKKVLALVLSVVLCIGVLSGCGSSESKGQSAKEGSDVTLKIGVYLWPGWYPWFVAEEKGYFEEAGLNVELVPFSGYSDMLQAFYSGNINVMGATLCDMISAHNEGIGFKLIMVNDNSNGADAIVVADSIASTDDIKGETIAVETGTLEHFLLLTALEEWGIDPSEVTITNMSMSDAAPAMISGSVKVAAMADPYGQQVETSEKGTKIFTSADTPGLIADSTFVSDDLINNHPEEVQKLVDVWFKTVDYVKTNEEDAIKIMAEWAELPEDEYKALQDGVKIFSLEDNLAAFNEEKEELTYLPYAAKKEAEFLLEQELIDKVLDSYDDMFDASFVENTGK